MSFRRIDDATWRRLITAVEGGTLSAPLSSFTASRYGVSDAPELIGVAPASLQAIAASVLEERATRPPATELVWTGPEGAGGAGRKTALVLQDLFAGAQKSVWLAGYSIDQGKRLFAPLSQAMNERDVDVRFLLHPKYDYKERPAKTIHAGADRILNRFLERNWPFEGKSPDLYYDPRPLTPGVFASMHIKAVVIDEARVLIGSANFTDRGTTRSYEAGALIHDPDFARRLITQLRSLIDGGLVHPHGYAPPDAA